MPRAVDGDRAEVGINHPHDRPDFEVETDLFDHVLVLVGRGEDLDGQDRRPFVKRRFRR